MKGGEMETNKQNKINETRKETRNEIRRTETGKARGKATVKAGKTKIKLAGIATGIYMLLQTASPAFAKDTSVSMAAYADSREMGNVTVTASSQKINGSEIDFWGFIDIFSEYHSSVEERVKLQDAYSEMRLTKETKKGSGIRAGIEYNGNLKDFHIWRPGVFWQPGFGELISGVNLNINAFPNVITRKGKPQPGPKITLYGGGQVNRKTSLGGFFNYNPDSGEVVSEIQLNRGIAKNIDAVVEARYNGFRKGDKAGVAFGVEYKL